MEKVLVRLKIELTWGQEFCEVTLLIRYNSVAILSNPAVILMNPGRILMNTDVVLTIARIFLTVRTALSYFMQASQLLFNWR